MTTESAVPRLTFDNQQVIVPNNKIWGDVITNLTAMDVRRIVRLWARQEEYWETFWDLNAAIKIRFEEESIELAQSMHRLLIDDKHITQPV